MACPNCGFKDWEDKKDRECERCGFKKIKTTELPPAKLIFCDECGCTMLDGCKVHDAAKQKPVKL